MSALIALAFFTSSILVIKTIDTWNYLIDTRNPFKAEEYFSIESDTEMQCWAEAGTLTDIPGVSRAATTRATLIMSLDTRNYEL
jgi:hypothetical protein